MVQNSGSNLGCKGRKKSYVNPRVQPACKSLTALVDEVVQPAVLQDQNLGISDAATAGTFGILRRLESED
jgi:hypothetical protein